MDQEKTRTHRIVWQGDAPLPKGCQTYSDTFRVLVGEVVNARPSDGLIVERLARDTMGGEMWRRDTVTQEVERSALREAILAMLPKEGAK